MYANERAQVISLAYWKLDFIFDPEPFGNLSFSSLTIPILCKKKDLHLVLPLIHGTKLHA
ncbi:hypothetical protein DTL42_14585 [Bremerella cremea]|uniref:Uncharacterized protein n=1 Tax=Bremerella cremea TaxID=1031537 RepID=A0A368KPZ9_9BACT|nr:hypothetical protein DTL42_14585 [Bremerella cremea]